MDYAISRQIWKWCIRRHPNKTKRWIKKKYYGIGTGNVSTFGPFREEKQEAKEKLKKTELVKLAKIPIIRQRMIKDEANPYSPSWKKYFEERLSKEWKEHPTYNGYIKGIWRQQKGKCPVCQQLIVIKQEWDAHHIKPKKEGGGGCLENMALVHPTCHRQLHSNAKVALSIKTMMGGKVA
jgi:RNA-directed DNA polymerase